MTKKFPTHAAMTLITGICMGEFSKAHECAEWVMGHEIWTHELPSYFDRIKAKFLAKCPTLPQEATSENYMQVLEEAICLVGDEVEIERGAEQRTQNPLDSLLQMGCDNDKVVAVVSSL